MTKEFFLVADPEDKHLKEGEIDYRMMRDLYFKPTRLMMKEGPDYTTMKFPKSYSDLSTHLDEIISVALCLSFNDHYELRPILRTMLNPQRMNA